MANNISMDEVTINGETYVKKGSVATSMANAKDGLEAVLVRTCSAGVHYGYLKEHNGTVVTLIDARRIWEWDGAFTLSELATSGSSKPNNCKFSCVVPKIILTEAIEIIPLTEVALKNLDGVKNYKC